jgi:hypothetical protein
MPTEEFLPVVIENGHETGIRERVLGRYVIPSRRWVFAAEEFAARCRRTEPTARAAVRRRVVPWETM